MTVKKRALILLGIFVLLAAALLLFSLGLMRKESAPPVFYLFASLALASFLAAGVLVAVHFKALVSYDLKRFKRKIKDLDFSVMEMPLTMAQMAERLQARGYSQIAEHLFHKEVNNEYTLEDCYAVLLALSDTVDIANILEKFDRRVRTYHIGYLFAEDNADAILASLKEYIKKTVADVEIHRYSYQKFFTPIVITGGKAYYLSAGSIFNEYRFGVSEALRVLKGAGEENR